MGSSVHQSPARICATFKNNCFLFSQRSRESRRCRCLSEVAHLHQFHWMTWRLVNPNRNYTSIGNTKKYSKSNIHIPKIKDILHLDHHVPCWLRRQMFEFEPANVGDLLQVCSEVLVISQDSDATQIMWVAKKRTPHSTLWTQKSHHSIHHFVKGEASWRAHKKHCQMQWTWVNNE